MERCVARSSLDRTLLNAHARRRQQHGKMDAMTCAEQAAGMPLVPTNELCGLPYRGDDITLLRICLTTPSATGLLFWTPIVPGPCFASHPIIHATTDFVCKWPCSHAFECNPCRISSHQIVRAPCNVKITVKVIIITLPGQDSRWNDNINGGMAPISGSWWRIAWLCVEGSESQIPSGK